MLPVAPLILLLRLMYTVFDTERHVPEYPNACFRVVQDQEAENVR
jgi:hypothetical protein